MTGRNTSPTDARSSRRKARVPGPNQDRHDNLHRTRTCSRRSTTATAPVQIEREEQQGSTETSERDGAGGQRARTRTGPVSAAHRGQSREHHGYRRAGHAGKQAPGHGSRPQESERAGNFDHTCAPARQPAQQRLTRGENFTCAELAMTPVKCHSQPTQCAYIGNLARGSCVPLRTPTAARLSPARGRAGGVAPAPSSRCADG